MIYKIIKFIYKLFFKKKVRFNEKVIIYEIPNEIKIPEDTINIYKISNDYDFFIFFDE